MHILSSYKDYYDYLSGIYGVDEKIILDRRKFDIPVKRNRLDRPCKIVLKICGQVIEGWWDQRFYYGKDLENAPGSTYYKKQKGRYSFNTVNHPHYSFPRPHETSLRSSEFKVREDIYKDEDKSNQKENCPILLRGWDKYLKFPILKELELNKYLMPKDLYLMLTEWLAPKDMVTDTMSDKQKVASKGFTKESFRNTKHRLK